MGRIWRNQPRIAISLRFAPMSYRYQGSGCYAENSLAIPRLDDGATHVREAFAKAMIVTATVGMADDIEQGS